MTEPEPAQRLLNQMMRASRLAPEEVQRLNRMTTAARLATSCSACGRAMTADDTVYWVKARAVRGRWNTVRCGACFRTSSIQTGPSLLFGQAPCLAASVSGGRRPFAGDVMIDVRHSPLIWKAPLPRSIQNVL